MLNARYSGTARTFWQKEQQDVDVDVDDGRPGRCQQVRLDGDVGGGYALKKRERVDGVMI